LRQSPLFGVDAAPRERGFRQRGRCHVLVRAGRALHKHVFELGPVAFGAASARFDGFSRHAGT